MFFALSPEEEISDCIAHGPTIQVVRVMEALIQEASVLASAGTCTCWDLGWLYGKVRE